MTTHEQIIDMHAEQLRIEEDMTQRGAERFVRDTRKATEKGRETDTLHGSVILGHRLEALSTAIAGWKAETAAGKPGAMSGSAYRKLKDMEPNTLAYLTLRKVLAGLSTPRNLQAVAMGLGQTIEDEQRFAELRVKERKAFDRIVKGTNLRVSERNRHIYAVRMASEVDSWEAWSKNDVLQVGIKLIDILMEATDLIQVSNISAHSTQTLMMVTASPQTLKWIDKRIAAASLLRPIFEPMVVPPKPWTTINDGGYLSSCIRPLSLVKTNNKPYLEELRHTDMPVIYAAVNALQETAWQVNQEVLDVLQVLWDSGNGIAGLPKRGGLDMPPKPHDIDTNELARKSWRIAASKVHQANIAERGHRISIASSLDIATRYAQYPAIYFPYQLDWRGRIYAVPQLNPQGDDVQKALLRFSKGKPLGASGARWLAIHGANTAGNDKCSLEDRELWVLLNSEEICAIAANPYDNRGWCGAVGGVKIDKPWQFLAFCFDWAGYRKYGSSFVSRIPVAMDGSCSGIQHFSAMLRDEIGGAAVNLVPSALPQDVYGKVAKEVIKQAEKDLKHGTVDSLTHDDEGVARVKQGTKTIAKQWLDFGITRKITKRSVMTLAYGSKEYGFKEQLMEDIIGPLSRSGEPFPFDGDGFAAAAYMAKAIWVSVNRVLVKAGEAMKWLQQAAGLAAGEGLPVHWTTPVGFPVMQRYQDMKAHRVDTVFNGGVRLQLKLNIPQPGLDKRKQASGISPNFVHSCDAAHMMLTVAMAAEEGLDEFAMIHDSFGTTAGYVETLYGVVRDAFVKMYEEVEVLEQFRDDVSRQLSPEALKELPPLPLRGTLDISQVRESQFCFA